MWLGGPDVENAAVIGLPAGITAALAVLAYAVEAAVVIRRACKTSGKQVGGEEAKAQEEDIHDGRVCRSTAVDLSREGCGVLIQRYEKHRYRKGRPFKGRNAILNNLVPSLVVMGVILQWYRRVFYVVRGERATPP